MVGGVVANRSTHPIQRTREIGLPEVQITRADMSMMAEIAFGQRAAFQSSQKLLIGHDFSRMR